MSYLRFQSVQYTIKQGPQLWICRMNLNYFVCCGARRTNENIGLLFIDAIIIFCMLTILFKLCCSWSYFVGTEAAILEKIICDAKLSLQAIRSRFMGFSPSLWVLAFVAIVLSVFFLSPPLSPAFLFSSVFMGLSSSMPFIHFVFIPLLSCVYRSCFCFLDV